MGWTPAWLIPLIPLGLCSVWLLSRTIRSLAMDLRESTILTVPMAPSQTLTLCQKGPLDLFVEARRGTNLSGLDFALRSETGTAIPLQHVVLRMTVSGLSRVRLQVRSLYICPARDRSSWTSLVCRRVGIPRTGSSSPARLVHWLSAMCWPWWDSAFFSWPLWLAPSSYSFPTVEEWNCQSGEGVR